MITAKEAKEKMNKEKINENLIKIEWNINAAIRRGENNIKEYPGTMNDDTVHILRSNGYKVEKIRGNFGFVEFRISW